MQALRITRNGGLRALGHAHDQRDVGITMTHLAPAALQRLLDGVFVELGQQTGGGDAVDGQVGLELLVSARVGNVLNTDNNLHA